MELLLIVGGVILLSSMAYIAIMIFFPEWVGITGKTALRNQQSHLGHDVEPDSLSKFIGDHDKSEDTNR